MRAGGQVSLVGAGPGDPDLITVRGLRLLRAADAVVHDRLAPVELLDHARPTAWRIDVGKGRGHRRMPQEAIGQLLVDLARAGLEVVRLKGGDPFVFGRGHEELAACRAAGVPCQVVSGVSSAIAAPAAAGIPVTHRGVARSFLVVTAETADGAHDDPVTWRAAAACDTVVVMMGASRLDAVCRRLMACGRDGSAPAAIVERGTLPGQRVLRSRLDSVAADARRAALAAPLVLVVGDTSAADLGGLAATPSARLDRPLAALASFAEAVP